eukprot:jgi/Tetstr1/456984/TSEL_043649.t1
MSEHVWPALHSFHTSIKASVGLEVRFDKMHAYNADMEAARREAPADIEWPEQDGHHGIPVLNVPLGFPRYVQAYMRGKAEELQEKVDASLSKLLSAKPSRRERISFDQLDTASGMWTVAIPTARMVTAPHELRDVPAGYFFLPSQCLAPVVGSQIILPSTEHNPVTVDLYGDARMNLPAPGDAHWRVQQHDPIADAFRDHFSHDPGIVVSHEVDDLFKQAVPLGNTVPRDEVKDLKGPLRDIMDVSEYTGMVFGTVGEMSKGVRRVVRGVACMAADRGALSSRGPRRTTRAHKEPYSQEISSGS